MAARSVGVAPSRGGRVALFVPSMRGGGAERFVVNLTGGLIARGVAVDVLLAQAEGPLLKCLPTDARLIDLGAPRMARAVVPLARYLRRERPRVLLASMRHTTIAALAARSLAGRRTAIVARVGSAVIGTALHRGMQRALLRTLERRWYRRAACVVAVSEGVAQDVRGLLGVPTERIRVIHNPVLSEAQLLAGPDVVGHPWFHDRAVPVVLAVARLVPEKDFPTLLRAIAAVRARRPVRLVVLGEGSERLRLERLIAQLGIADIVELAGFVDRPLPFMAAARVLALSSLHEGFGTVLVEAMAMGTPVVATDCDGGPGEILERGRFGRLVPVGDSAAFASALEAALAATADTVALKARARRFTVERITSEYLELLDACV